MADLSQRFGLTKFAEIGVKSGRLSGKLLKLVPKATLICVDPWRPYDDWPDWNAMQHKKHEREFDDIARGFGSRITKMKMTSVEAAKLIPDGSLCCVFIDGDHSYDAVVADIEAWMPKVRPGGVLSGHDYDNTDKYGNRFKGVDRAVEEKFADRFAIETDHVWWVQL